jgi:tetratricopeptide (TPR) repeat protein/tRNA A-37 threonylcarbamoyl transferase component Bud32
LFRVNKWNNHNQRMKKPFPPVPQTGRVPMTISAEHERRLLSRPVESERTDLYATDSNPEIRNFGRIVLRRDSPDANDFFHLGDLCARKTLSSENLLILYVGKTINAYRRAGQVTSLPAERHASELAIVTFIQWVILVASELPTARNIAVALWAAAEIPVDQQSEALRGAVLGLARQYGNAGSRPASKETMEVRAVFLEPVSVPVPPQANPADLEEPAVLSEDNTDLNELDDTQPSQRSPIGGELHDAPTQGDVIPAPAPAAPVRDERDDAADDFRVGDVIRGTDARYDVKKVLRGGMGVIYICHDASGESVAIKTFQGRFLANERTRARFVQEGRTWVNLEKHPHIVQAWKIQTFGSEQVSSRPHILMEYVPNDEGIGTDLKSWIDHNLLDLPSRLHIALHICLGMAHAVRKVPGLVHRDLKPANILVRHDGIAKVTDFGLASVRASEAAPEGDEDAGEDAQDRETRLTRAGAVVGTLPYMSPEQCSGSTLDIRSDIYAFGAILYEMFTGQQMFNARTISEWIDAHLSVLPEFPAHQLNNIPPEIRDLTLRCLAKAADERPADWDTLIAELAALIEQFTGHVPVTEYSETELKLVEMMNKAYSLTEIGYGEDALTVYDQAYALATDRDYAWILARKGRTLRVLRRYPESLQALDAALAMNPNYGWAWGERGYTLQRMGRMVEAMDSYRSAVENNVGKLWMYTKYADMLLDAGQIDEADRQVQHVLTIDSINASAWYTKGRIEEARKNHELTLEAYRHAAQYAPTNKYYHRAEANLLIYMGRTAEAIAPLDRLVELNPDDPQVWARLARAFRTMKRYEEAAGNAQRAVTLNPHYAAGWNEYGLVMRAAGRHEEAVEHFTRAMREDPQNVTYLHHLAESYLALNKHQDAFEVLTRAVMMDKSDPVLWATRGQALRRLGRFKEALTSYDEALARNPRYAWAWNGRGLALESMNRREEALLSYERAVREDPKGLWYWINQIEPLLALGRYDDALELCDNAAAAIPDSAVPAARKGQILRRLARHAEAVEAYSRALAINPQYAWAWSGKGLAHAALEDWQTAVACYEQAITHDPTDVWFWYNLGEAQYQLEHYTAAVRSLNRALELDPQHEPSRWKRTEARKKLQGET